MFWTEVALLALSFELKEYEPLIWALKIGLAAFWALPLAEMEPLTEKPLKGEKPVAKLAFHDG